jgi:hypothetical protein
VINCEIIPSETLFAFGILAAAISRSVPNDSALGLAETLAQDSGDPFHISLPSPGWSWDSVDGIELGET